MNRTALFQLMAWLSPSYPVGAYAYSHGIEWAVEAGTVRDEASLADWIETILLHGGGWSDAVLFSHAFDAADVQGDDVALARINDLACALAPSAERALETTAQGTAFLTTAIQAWPWPGMDATAKALGLSAAYPVAVAAVAHGHGLDKAMSLSGFLHGFAANLVSAGVRLIPLGQTAGQRILARLESTVESCTAKALQAPLEDMGGIAILSDIAAMRHETQYTRLFRS